MSLTHLLGHLGVPRRGHASDTHPRAIEGPFVHATRSGRWVNVQKRIYKSPRPREYLLSTAYSLEFVNGFPNVWLVELGISLRTYAGNE